MKIGIDLGGTKTEAILIDHNGKELSRKRIKTEKNYQGTLNGIKFLVAEFENLVLEMSKDSFSQYPNEENTEELSSDEIEYELKKLGYV